jgi:non-homologous end joining protein Ku
MAVTPGEEIDKAEVVKGYEYGRGQFVTFTPESAKHAIPPSELASMPPLTTSFPSAHGGQS